ncbi:MAG TPA: M48 family metalloprotease [Gemmatimonadales bacterium]
MRAAPVRAGVRVLLAGLVAWIASCARNPVTGKNEISLVSESQEIQMGQEYAQQIVRSMGVYDDKKVQDYVSRLGMGMAAKSERPQLPWAFYVMDDPTVNAFALPGGSIFVTRGILTHMNNEAELVGVLGHEIGHVTARHSVQQMTRQQIAQIGVGVGSILSSDVAKYAGLASQGLGVLFLKYGRDAESQSDQLGFKYMVRDGYDPRAMASMFTTLQRVSQLEGAGDIPEWASTHPDPGNRVEATKKRLDTLSVPVSKLRDGRETYMPVIAGMTYGEDPRQGYIEGNTFYHPGLRFKMDLPAGWQAQNSPEALVAVSPEQDAMVQLTAPGKGTPDEAIKQFVGQEGVKTGQVSSAAVNSLPAASTQFEAQTEQGAVQGVVSFIKYGELTYRILGYTPAGKLEAHAKTFGSTINSFSELTDKAHLDVQPFKVELIKLDREMTIAEFNKQHPSTIPVERVAVVNGFDTPEDRVAAGTTIKRIIGGQGAAAAQKKKVPADSASGK